MGPLSRRRVLRELLRAAELDALLVTDLVNVRYLTGFTGSNAALLVHAGGEQVSRFCTDGRYLAQSAVEVPDLQRMIERSGVLVLVAAAAALGIRRLGFESDTVSVDAHTALDEAAGDAVALRRAPGLVQQLRMVKDDAEVAALRAACAVADAALADLVAAGGLRPGRTERAAAHDLDARMRGLGASGPAFETILAAGAHSAIPHHHPSEAVLARGDLVTLDFGALVAGYHSDMTRTFVLGPAAGWQRELYALVATAQAAGRAACVPGTELAAVDAAARDLVVAAGRGAEFLHPVGHGVGLQIHEAPALSATATGALAAAMAVTVEPGVYLAGRGGVRIEDTMIVRDLIPEVLTCTGRDLVEL